MAEGGDEWFGLENASRRKKEAELLYEEAKKLVSKDENYVFALKKLQEAEKLFSLQKYKRRIDQLINFMKSEDISFEEEVRECHTSQLASHEEPIVENFITLAAGLKMRKDLYDMLYGYQVEGVQWLYKLFTQCNGCVLADDMGLGKTVQTIALLISLLEANLVRHILIVAPTTLLINWGKEFHKWAPAIKVFKFDGSLSVASRLKTLRFVQQEGGVLLSTYDLCRNFKEEICSFRGEEFVWDYLILDEGHKIKNPTKTTKSMHEIPSRNRVILTGTPIQNNLRDLWALYDFVTKGTLLGTYRTFKMKFETPIMEGREKRASNRTIIQSRKTAEALREIYSPYFLRRTKQEVLKGPNALVKLPKKIDWVIWIYLSEPQIKVYKDFLNSPEIKQLILRANMKSALVSINVLKKICDHPRLLSRHVCNEVLNDPNLSINSNTVGDEDDDGVSITNVPDEQLIAESAKLSFCLGLLEELRAFGHKTLLFSQSTKMLDIIQQILTNRGWRMSRLDGRVINMQKRDGIVRAFEQSDSIPLCLLSSQVGGVGLTLTSANRVIIYDPSWNPAIDSQAIDRAYRIGQKRDVIVYRLITCGSVEEKIYKRQIFKDSVIKQTVGAAKDPTRYFTGADLRQLLQFSDPRVSETFQMINETHGSDFTCDQMLLSHLQSVKSSSDVLNVHDHSLLFSTEEDEVLEEIEVISIIDSEVSSAKENLNKESQSTKEILATSGAFYRPFQLEVLERKKGKKPDNYVAPANPSEVIDIRDSLPGDTDFFSSFVEDFSEIQIIDNISGASLDHALIDAPEDDVLIVDSLKSKNSETSDYVVEAKDKSMIEMDGSMIFDDISDSVDVEAHKKSLSKNDVSSDVREISSLHSNGVKNDVVFKDSHIYLGGSLNVVDSDDKVDEKVNSEPVSSVDRLSKSSSLTNTKGKSNIVDDDSTSDGEFDMSCIESQEKHELIDKSMSVVFSESSDDDDSGENVYGLSDSEQMSDVDSLSGSHFLTNSGRKADIKDDPIGNSEYEMSFVESEEENELNETSALLSESSDDSLCNDPFSQKK